MEASKICSGEQDPRDSAVGEKPTRIIVAADGCGDPAAGNEPETGAEGLGEEGIGTRGPAGTEI